MLGYLANILNLLIQTPDKFSVIKDCFCLSSSSYYSGFMQYWLRVRDWVAVKLDQMVCWKWDFCKKTNNICISLKLTMISCGQQHAQSPLRRSRFEHHMWGHIQHQGWEHIDTSTPRQFYILSVLIHHPCTSNFWKTFEKYWSIGL